MILRSPYAHKIPRTKSGSFFFIVTIILLLYASSHAAKDQLVFGWTSPWGGTFPTEKEIACLTHLVIYPVSPTSPRGDFESLFSQSEIDSMVRMAARTKTKVLVSLGTGHQRLPSDMKKDPTYMGRFVSYLTEFVAKNNIDGIDNAWEILYLDDEKEKHAELVLMREQFGTITSMIRDSLDARFGMGKKMLTVTVSCINECWFQDPDYIKDNTIYAPGFWQRADYVMMMNYNDGLGAQHSTLGSAQRQLAAWEKAGMPRSKVVLGIPFFGQARWADETIGNTTIPSVLFYNQIIAANPAISAQTNTVTHMHKDTNGQLVEFVYGFNGPALIQEKMRYTKSAGLPGILFWKLGFDVPLDHPLSLLGAIDRANGNSGTRPPIHPAAVEKKWFLITTDNKVHLVDHQTNKVRLEIHSLSGRRIWSGELSRTQPSIDLNALGSGSYIFTAINQVHKVQSAIRILF